MKKERHLLKYRSTRCLNCEHPLDISDQFCPNCSQLNSTKRLSFHDFFNEFFAGIFAYDSRLYRTLGVLLFRPGKISKDYIEGKRVRYANPYRFYLSASIIFFLVWSLTHSIEPSGGPMRDMTAEDRAEADSLIRIEREKNPQLDIILPPLPAVDSVKTYPPEAEFDSLPLWESSMEKGNVFMDFYEETDIRNPTLALDSLKYRDSGFNHWLYKKSVDIKRFSSDQDLFWSFFLGKVPFIIFFYLPVFALFIWLLYLRRPFTYMEHLIFTFHNQTTWFVLFGVAIHLDLLFGTSILTWIAAITFLVYLYKAFRIFYGQSRVKTLLKFIIVNIIFLFLALIAAVFSLAASFAIY